MRIDIHSNELTRDVLRETDASGVGPVGVQLNLRGGNSIVFWRPSSPERARELAAGFERIAAIFRGEQ